MTYVFAWKYGDSAFIVADSAATKVAFPATKMSSFGEPHAPTEGGFFEECLQKIVPITENIVLAYSGDVSLSSEIISIVKLQCQHGVSLSKAFDSAEMSLGPFSSAKCVALLAVAMEETGAKIYRWDNQQCNLEDIAEQASIGSMPIYYNELNNYFLCKLKSGELPVDLALPTLIALIQSYSVNDYLINVGVGGQFFGLRVCPKGIAWQEDTNFVLYEPSFKNRTIISALIRDCVLVVNSSATNEIRCFATQMKFDDFIDWQKKWKDKIQVVLNSNDFVFWIFLNTKERVITIIRRSDLSCESKFIKGTFDSNGMNGLLFSSELMNLLNEPLNELHDSSTPLRLNFRND